MATKKTTTESNEKKKTKTLATPKIVKLAEGAADKSEKLVKVGSSQVGGFIDFIRSQGIIGLAVGLAIGTAAGAAVKAIVDGFINPIVGFIIGGVDLTKLKWVVVTPNKDGVGGLVFSWGSIISALITLVATAFVIYWLIHIARLDRLDKKKDA